MDDTVANNRAKNFTYDGTCESSPGSPASTNEGTNPCHQSYWTNLKMQVGIVRPNLLVEELLAVGVPVKLGEDLIEVTVRMRIQVGPI